MPDAPTRIRPPELPPVTAPEPPALPPVDIRRKRPPALSFLLRWATMRRLGRILTLLTLDFVGVFAAIWTALMVKAVIRDGDWAWSTTLAETKDTIAFAYLVCALLFARSGLYADRAVRPGLPRIVSSLFQVMIVALAFAVVNGEKVKSAPPERSRDTQSQSVAMISTEPPCRPTAVASVLASGTTSSSMPSALSRPLCWMVSSTQLTVPNLRTPTVTLVAA